MQNKFDNVIDNEINVNTYGAKFDYILSNVPHKLFDRIDNYLWDDIQELYEDVIFTVSRLIRHD